MVVHKDTGEIEHKHFHQLIDYFDDGDVMVLNNTKVFPARMWGNKEKTGARIEVFLLRELIECESRLWDVLVDPARKIRFGINSTSVRTIRWLLRLLIIPLHADVHCVSCLTVLMRNSVRN